MFAAENLTPWFPAYVLPVRPGVYETNLFLGRTVYQKWNGKYWCFSGRTVDDANNQQGRSAFQYVGWRGLNRNPSLEK